MSETTIKPGHYPDISNDAYHSGPGISKSHLDDIAGKSPLHYWQKRINPNRPADEKSDALRLGDVIHKAILEPDVLSGHIIKLPADAPRRPTEKQRNAKKPSPETLEAIDFWDGFNKESLGKVIIENDEFDMVIAARDAVLCHPVAGPLFTNGLAEQSFYATDPKTGELIKCRTDLWRPGSSMIVDLKSAIDASPDGFGRAAANYRYDVQAVWYPDVCELAIGESVDHFVFVAIEKEAPWAVGVYFWENEYESAFNGRIVVETPGDKARALARRDLDLIAECRRTNSWPDYGASPQGLRLPGWARRTV